MSRKYKQAASETMKEMTETAYCLYSHPMFLCSVRASAFGYRTFLEVGKFERLFHSVLARFSSSFSLCPTSLNWTACLSLTVSIQSTASSLPSRPFLPRRWIPYGMSSSSMPNILLVQPRAIVSHVNWIISY